MLTLTLPLLLDGIASLTALITFFTEGIGARGSQFTLTLLTASVMLIALNRDGLPRGIYLLRHVLLVAAAIIAINALLDAHPDGIVPLLGEGVPPLLRGNLRRGDVISRCSVSQFVIMLPQANYENSCMVAERLTGAFYRRYPHSSARLRCMVQPLIPNE